MHHSLRQIGLIIIMLCMPLASLAAPSAATDNAQLSLQVQTPMEPGEPTWALIEFNLADHWHIYWQNPGDSGLAAELNWQLPAGYSAGPIHWQTPTRIEYSGLYNYGYEGRTGLLIPITTPDSLSDDPITISVDVEYLICKDICIPESASLSATITPNQSTDISRIDNYAQSLPLLSDMAARYSADEQSVSLAFDVGELTIADLWWYPLDDGLITNASDQPWQLSDGTLTITAERGAGELTDAFRGILKRTDADGAVHALHISAARSDDIIAAPTMQKTAPAESNLTLIGALALAFIGGIILNIMPCVLPVLSLKTLSIVKKADSEAGAIRLQGLAYTAGIVVSFIAIAGLLIALQQAGQSIGWGFQLQSPLFVTALIYVLFIVGLNLSGLFELPAALSNSGNELAGRGGLGGSFFTGALATIVATPCTAPFMATALGFAFTQPPAVSLAIFACLGFGLAFPLLLISFIPALRHVLPKPGAWMLRFKQFLAFPIYASVIWLLWVLVQQSGAMGLLLSLTGLLLIGFLLWLWQTGAATWFKLALSLPIIFGIALGAIEQRTATTPANSAQQTQRFSGEALQRHIDEGTPVFVDATAAWCITCKVNERVALKDEAVQAAFAERNIVLMVADWTNRDDAITRYLAAFGRNGVPLYVYYPSGGEPRVLPQLLTPSIVLDAIQ